MRFVDRIQALPYYAVMEWLLGIFAWLGALAAISTIGEKRDDWLDEDRRLSIGQWLGERSWRNKTAWLQGANSAFLGLFDWVYGGSRF